MSSEKEKKELYWKTGNLKNIRTRKILPQDIVCTVTEEDEEGKLVPTNRTHTLHADKVYVFIDEKGTEEDGIVLCLQHNQPISVRLTHSKSPSSGETFGRV